MPPTTQTKNFKFSGLDVSEKGKIHPTFKWVFTLNNYTNDDVDRLKHLSLDVIEYLIAGEEVGESGTPHLQGTVRFTTKRRLTGAKRIIGGNPHMEPCVAFDESVEYCKKEGRFFEVGKLKASSQGKRNDIESVKEDIVVHGITDMTHYMENHTSFFINHENFINRYIAMHHYAPDSPKRFPNTVWQAELYEYLKGPVCDRKIIFICDYEGGKGKTYFTKIYRHDHQEGVQVLTPGKLADMAFAYKQSTKVLFVDCPRSKMQYLSYEFLEGVKNGNLFSGKYVSTEKVFKPPHVVVFMNDEPNLAMLSRDRYQIVWLTSKLCHVHPGGRCVNATGILGTANNTNLAVARSSPFLELDDCPMTPGGVARLQPRNLCDVMTLTGNTIGTVIASPQAMLINVPHTPETPPPADDGDKKPAAVEEKKD